MQPSSASQARSIPTLRVSSETHLLNDSRELDRLAFGPGKQMLVVIPALEPRCDVKIPGATLCCRGLSSCEPQFPRNPLHGLDAKRNVLIQIDPEVASPVHNVVAVYAAGKGFVLHLLANGFRFYFGE
jgi:hypothetical protein